MRPSWCRRGSRWCCSADPLQGCPLLSSSGWITVSYLHEHTSAGMIRGLQIFTSQTNNNAPPWMNNYRFYLMSNCFSRCHLDFQKLPLDKRVSQALNGDLYFSNVLPEDSRPDYICYARFPHTQTIQQKQPISVTVLNSKLRHRTELFNCTEMSFPHILPCWGFNSCCLALDSFLCCVSCILPLPSVTTMHLRRHVRNVFTATRSSSALKMHYHRLMHRLMR